eukprot:m.53255 g.53255  ORF g.53255 m.53255 type:complete len:332 (-) comp12778_c0_seq1:77-1072(-)
MSSAMGPADARLNKLLSAFNLLDHWPKLEQRGVRNVFDLGKLSDQELTSLLQLSPPQLRKLRAVLTKLEAARNQGAQQPPTSPSHNANPFASPSNHSSARGSRVLNLAPAPGFADPIDPRVRRAPSTNRSIRSTTPAMQSSAATPTKTFNVPAPVVTTQPATTSPAKVASTPRKSVWAFDFEVDVLPAVVHSGWATKCGGKIKSWQKRFFVLRSDGTLTYSKAGALNEFKGVIDLKDATVVNGPNNCNWLKEDAAPTEAAPHTRVEIVSPARTYKMFCASEDEALAWHENLQKVVSFLRRATNRPRPSEQTIRGGVGYQRMLAEIAHIMSS